MQALGAGLRLLLVACFAGLMGSPGVTAREVRTMFVGAPQDAPRKAVLVANGSAIEIELPRRNFSPELALPPGDLVVAVLPEAPGGKEVPAGSPTVRIPAAWTRCLLLFFPDPTNEVFPVKVLPVNAATANFPEGHARIFNFTKAVVRMSFGTEKVIIKPGQSHKLKPPRTGAGGFPVAIDCVLPGATSPTALFRSTWRHDPDARMILLVTQAPGRKVPQVTGFLDRVDGPEEE